MATSPPVTPCDQEFKRKTYRHCLWLIAKAGKEYAIWAAGWYEDNGSGMLDGLTAKITEKANE
jgi:hypothetical protein